MDNKQFEFVFAYFSTAHELATYMHSMDALNSVIKNLQVLTCETTKQYRSCYEGKTSFLYPKFYMHMVRPTKKFS